MGTKGSWRQRAAPLRTPVTRIRWGGRGVVGSRPRDPLTVWRERAADVRGAAVDAGHFLVEERPADSLDLLAGFLR